MFINPDGFDREEIGRICYKMSWACIGGGTVLKAVGIPALGFGLAAMMFSVIALILALTDHWGS